MKTQPSELTWKIDEGWAEHSEWWVVSDRIGAPYLCDATRVFKADTLADAEWLCDLLNKEKP